MMKRSSRAVPDVIWQPSLLDAGSEPRINESFDHLERIQLDPQAWVDYAPGWLHGSDQLFEQLLERSRWGQRSRRMYDRIVQEPRLTSGWQASSGDPLEPPVLEQMRAVLSERYAVEIDSVGLNLYRDGRDGVAWHGDHIRKEIENPVVALVSIGEPRKFLLRPREGGRTVTFLLGRGDLLVTGGRTQRTWQHSVPKVAQAGPRISIAFRHDMEPKGYVDTTSS